MSWHINTEADKQLIENLIKDRKTELFKTKYRAIVFKVIESANKKINPKSPLSFSQKDELFDAFIGHLLANDAWRLNAYLHPKRMSVQENTDEKKNYTLVSSQAIVGDVPKYDADGFPTLKFWVYEQCDFFIRAKLIIDGVASLNVDVINNFLLKYNRPGCLSMISKWIFDNHVYSGEPQYYDVFVERVAKDFATDIFHYESLRNAFLNYHYGKEFYTYFKEWILKPYFNQKFFKKVPNPIIPRKTKGHDPATDIVLNDEIESLYSGPEGNVSPLPNERRMEKEELLEKVTVVKKIQEKQLISSLEGAGESHIALNIETSNDISAEIDYREKLQMIFKEMNRSSSGQKQVEVLKLLFLETYEVDGFVPSDKEIAKVLNISVGNLRTKKSRALETAREIAVTLGIEL